MVGVERISRILGYAAALVGVLPVLPFLHGWVLLVLLTGVGVGIMGDWRGHFLLSKRAATLFSGAFFVLFLLQVSGSNLVEPTVELLCLLLAVRLVSEKSPRHLLQLFLLATIVLAASSLLTLDMAYLGYLVVFVLLVSSGLVLLSFYSSDPQIRFSRSQWRMLWKVTALLPVGSLLLMLVLFVILPRTQLPLWNFLNPKAQASVGMSDQVRPGSVAELASNSQPAFRVEMPRLPLDALYWRGVVFNRIVGQTWQRSSEPPPAERLVPAADADIEATFYAEPKADRYLVTLDSPRQITQIRHQFAADGTVTVRRRSGQKARYRVRAQLGAKRQLRGSQELYLQVPGNLPPRLQELAKQLEQAGGPRAKLSRLEEFFRQQQLSYANTQLTLTDNPVETFLFDTKRGYCEYFASSFALLLRMAEVPTRLVGGYLGGDYNELGGYFLVNEDLAHVWVEVLDEQGFWQRYDPSRLAVNAGEALLAKRQRTWQFSLGNLSDALFYYWSRLVLNFDMQQQFGLVRQIGRQVKQLKPQGETLLSWGGWLVAGLGIVGWLIQHQRRGTREQRIVRAYRRRLARCGGVVELPNHLGLFDLARISGHQLCYEFAEIYGRSYYSDRALNKADFKRLKEIVAALAVVRLHLDVAFEGELGDNVHSSKFGSS